MTSPTIRSRPGPRCSPLAFDEPSEVGVLLVCRLRTDRVVGCDPRGLRDPRGSVDRPPQSLSDAEGSQSESDLDESGPTGTEVTGRSREVGKPGVPGQVRRAGLLLKVRAVDLHVLVEQQPAAGWWAHEVPLIAAVSDLMQRALSKSA